MRIIAEKSSVRKGFLCTYCRKSLSSAHEKCRQMCLLFCSSRLKEWAGVSTLWYFICFSSILFRITCISHSIVYSEADYYFSNALQVVKPAVHIPKGGVTGVTLRLTQIFITCCRWVQRWYDMYDKYGPRYVFAWSVVKFSMWILVILLGFSLIVSV